MATIHIIRPNEYMNRYRDYGLYINEKKVAELSNNKTITHQLPPGRYTFQAKIDWCYSPKLTFEIAEGEAKTFTVSGFKSGRWLVPLSLAIILLNSLVSFMFKTNFYILFLLGFAIFGVFIYYITLGRKKYLTLKETTSTANGVLPDNHQLAGFH